VGLTGKGDVAPATRRFFIFVSFKPAPWAQTATMKSALRLALLIIAFAGFVVFFSFHLENLGPKQTITVGLNFSPWLKWSRIKGIGEFGRSVEVNFLSWSATGLIAGVVALALRTRVK
jgi:hypothetical protein